MTVAAAGEDSAGHRHKGTGVRTEKDRKINPACNCCFAGRSDCGTNKGMCINLNQKTAEHGVLRIFGGNIPKDNR